MKVLLVVLKGEEKDIRAAATKISIENQMLIEKIEIRESKEVEIEKIVKQEQKFWK